MTGETTFIYSPFSQHTEWCDWSRSLLLQFVLNELILGMQSQNLYYPSSTFFPFDWGHDAGPLNKIEEHLLLFPLAFPKMHKECKRFANCLKKQKLAEIFLCLKPFLQCCAKSEFLCQFLEVHRVALKKLSSKEQSR